jgi:hypothetical protein
LALYVLLVVLDGVRDCICGRRRVISRGMRIILGVLLAAAAAAPATSQQTGPAQARPEGPAAVVQTSTVWGQVRSDRTGAPLVNALVEVVTRAPGPITAVSDTNGFYVLRGVPAGRRVLRVTHFDHAPHEVEILVTAGRQETVDFDLEFRPVRLAVLLADGARGLPEAVDTLSVVAGDLAPVTARALESSPGVAELGLVEAARDGTGYEPADPTDVLYVRGGVADLKLVLMNGSPVYAPFHVGGLISALDARVLRSANLHLGGAPSRLDGGLAYIMELESRSGRRRALHGEVGLDMLSGRVMLEGPLGKAASFLVSGRGVHGGGTGAWFMDYFPYGYGDVLTRVDLHLTPKHTVSASTFWNQETVRLDTVGAARERADWGNRAGSLRYRGAFGELEVLATAAMGHFRTTLPLGGIRPLNTEGTARRARASIDFEQPFAGARLFWGAAMDRTEFEYRAFPQEHGRGSTLVRTLAAGDALGAYAELLLNPIPRVTVRGGFRADGFTHVEGVRLAPRGSATMLLTDRAAVTLSAGLYNQYMRTPGRSLVFLGNVSPDSTAGPPLTVAEALHVVMTLTQDLGDGIRVGLEGYFKEYSGLHASAQRTTETSGVDVWVRRNSGSFTGWLGYSLAWLWEVDRDRSPRTQAFSGRHLVTSGVHGPLFGNGVFDVRMSYGAGLPYTAVPEPPIATPGFSMMSAAGSVSGASPKPAGSGAGAGPNPDVPVATEPSEPFIRLDAQLSRSFGWTWWQTDFLMTPYLKVINALNRRDAIFYHYDRAAGQSQPLADLPVIPIVGVEWRF